MRELQPIPQAVLRVLRLPIPYPRRAPEGPHSRARGTARLGRQRENTRQPDQDPTALRYPSRTSAHPDHTAQHRCQHRPAQPAHGECQGLCVLQYKNNMHLVNWFLDQVL